MRMNELNSTIVRTIIVLVLLMGVDTVFCGLNYASDKLQPGNRYKIIQPIYLKAVYKNLNDRRLNKETARAYLGAKRLYMKSEVAFQRKVPEGTIMTIIGPAPKKWYLFYLPNRYFVNLNPDLSRELDVILVLKRGIEGELDGLNPELFSRLE